MTRDWLRRQRAGRTHAQVCVRVHLVVGRTRSTLAAAEVAAATTAAAQVAAGDAADDDTQRLQNTSSQIARCFSIKKNG